MTFKNLSKNKYDNRDLQSNQQSIVIWDAVLKKKRCKSLETIRTHRNLGGKTQFWNKTKSLIKYDSEEFALLHSKERK